MLHAWLWSFDDFAPVLLILKGNIHLLDLLFPNHKIQKTFAACIQLLAGHLGAHSLFRVLYFNQEGAARRGALRQLSPCAGNVALRRYWTSWQGALLEMRQAGRPSDRSGNIHVQQTRVPENQRVGRVK
jgi:hypothetical protein